MDPLQTSIEYLKGIGPNRATLLREELGLRTYQDLLHFFPNRYIDPLLTTQSTAAKQCRGTGKGGNHPNQNRAHETWETLGCIF